MSETRRVVDELTGFTEGIVRQLSTEITANLIEETPVDTGWARANWVPQIGVPFTDNANAVNPDESAVSAQESRQQQGVASVFNYSIELGQVFISNNVPYILRLNDGWSQQAPAQFVEREIEKGIQTVVERAVSP